ncbi:variant leucine-rich repeat-containing protein [Leucobacter musarum]|uniref:variant leucine-rich repeat-containing protein n=1 Tax=Leucobacter musarum TaxID=1930747 RepID=UPI0006A7C8EE|nr:hypothetical protein [Leucobacter musarum]
MNSPQDADRYAANARGVPPRVLAEIAARRWDLHAEIAANPGAYPELIQWMRAVNPAAFAYAPMPPASPVGSIGAAGSAGTAGSPIPLRAPSWPQSPPAPRRRGGAGWWFAGCGCLVVAVIAIIVLVAALGWGAAVSTPDTRDVSQPLPSQSAAPDAPQAAPPTSDPEVDAQISQFEADRPRIIELAAQLEGNPVAPLVADLRNFRLDEKRAADPTIGIYEAKPIAERAAAFRAELEQSVAAAEARRSNASGSLTEGIVDAAGNGFIDVQYDAVTACLSEPRPGKENIGCVLAAQPLTVHLLPEAEVGSEWMNLMLVTHELAHVYQRADDQGAEDYSGAYNDLLAQGLFQGSKEVMADCYALTYYDQWSLSNGSESLGYGYVCDAAERQAIRDWAVNLNVPL